VKVYLLRHGETLGNIEGRFSGVTDTPLSELGRDQSLRVKDKILGLDFDHVISSPLSRAIDTARLAGQPPTAIEEGLREMDFGKFEGLTYQEIQDQYPQDFDQWTLEGRDFVFPEGESLPGFYRRIIGVYKDVLNRFKGERILVVAHSGVIRCILCHEISENEEHYWKYRVDNASVSVISYESDYVILDRLNG